MFIHFLDGLGFSLLSMFLFWMIDRRIRNATAVDVLWTLLVMTQGIYFLLVSVPSNHVLNPVFSLLLLFWGARLTLHLIPRIRAESEDPRYQEIRDRWQNSKGKFLAMYLFQGFSASIVSLPFLFLGGISDQDAKIAPLTFFAIGMFLSVLFEALADRQLARFLKERKETKTTFQGGLWKYSRHPNYFFQFLFWLFAAFAGTFSQLGFLGLLSPLFLLVLLCFITGIPPQEKRAMQRVDFKEYKRKTSALIPWFPKEPT